MSELEEQLIETTNDWHEAFRERGRHSFYHGPFYVREASCQQYKTIELLHSQRSFANTAGTPAEKARELLSAPLRLLRGVYVGFVTGGMTVHLREDAGLQVHLDIRRNNRAFQGSLYELNEQQLPRDVRDEKDFLLEQYEELLKTYSSTT